MCVVKETVKLNGQPLRLVITESDLKRIMKRKGYEGWKELYNYLKKEKDEFKILKRIHKMIDERNGFGSLRNSVYAIENILLIEAQNKKR